MTRNARPISPSQTNRYVGGSMTATITVSVDKQVAEMYTQASPETRKKIELLLNLWLHDFIASTRLLPDIMDEIGQKAEKRGLTLEILETFLGDE